MRSAFRYCLPSCDVLSRACGAEYLIGAVVVRQTSKEHALESIHPLFDKDGRRQNSGPPARSSPLFVSACADQRFLHHASMALPTIADEPDAEGSTEWGAQVRAQAAGSANPDR